MDTNVLPGGVFPSLPFLNKGLLPFSPTQLTSPQDHYPSNSWTSIQTCHRHCFLKITPPNCRKHVLSISACSKNLSHAAWKCQALWLPSSVHYISNACSDLPVPCYSGSLFLSLHLAEGAGRGPPRFTPVPSSSGLAEGGDHSSYSSD